MWWPGPFLARDNINKCEFIDSHNKVFSLGTQVFPGFHLWPWDLNPSLSLSFSLPHLLPCHFLLLISPSPLCLFFPPSLPSFPLFLSPTLLPLSLSHSLSFPLPPPPCLLTVFPPPSSSFQLCLPLLGFYLNKQASKQALFTWNKMLLTPSSIYLLTDWDQKEKIPFLKSLKAHGDL